MEECPLFKSPDGKSPDEWLGFTKLTEKSIYMLEPDGIEEIRNALKFIKLKIEAHQTAGSLIVIDCVNKQTMAEKLADLRIKEKSKAASSAGQNKNLITMLKGLNVSQEKNLAASCDVHMSNNDSARCKFLLIDYVKQHGDLRWSSLRYHMDHSVFVRMITDFGLPPRLGQQDSALVRFLESLMTD